MSTSEVQVIAKALYDSLLGGALQSLQTATNKLGDATGDDLATAVIASLPADAPREVKNLVLALGKEGKLNQLAAVVHAFEGFTQRGSVALTGEVVSANELDTKQRELIAQDLRSKYGDNLELRFSVDPSLVGGLIIRVGDQVLDNSLRTRLSAIQRSMLAS